jgi:hypothetical protein
MVHTWLADACEASLVQVQTIRVGAEERTHYMLLQPVREFAAERFSTQQTWQAQARLLQWQLGFVREQLATAPHTIAEIDAEMPHIHASIVAAVDDSAVAQAAQAAQLAVALRRHWEIDTRTLPPRMVAQALESALPGLADGDLRCELSLLLSFACLLGGEMLPALAHGERALALAPDNRRRAQALTRIAGPMLFSNRHPVTEAASLAEAVALAQQAGDVETECLAMGMQFLVLCNRSNDFVAAEAMASASQRKWERLGHRRNATNAPMDRASCWLSQGQVEVAFDAMVECEQWRGKRLITPGASWRRGKWAWQRCGCTGLTKRWRLRLTRRLLRSQLGMSLVEAADGRRRPVAGAGRGPGAGRKPALKARRIHA